MRLILSVFFIACSILPLAAQQNWTNIGPNGGLIDAMAADYKNPGTLFCGTNTGEVYKTTDDGQSWMYVTKLSGFVSKMAIDTLSGQRIIAACANDIFYSTNGGVTFSKSAIEDVEEVFDVQFSPLNPVQMYLVSEGIVYRSNNSGQSWSSIYEADDTTAITAFAFNPQDPQNTYYLATITDNGISTIERTTNDGANFSVVRALPLDWETRKLYVAADVNSTVMALTGDEDSTKIIRSINNGGSWNFVYTSGLPLISGFSHRTFYHWLPRRGNETEQVIGWSGGLIKTNNAGIAWSGFPNPQYAYTTLVRSPLDTSKFYGRVVGQNGLSKIVLTTFGTVSLTDINGGLTATAIRRMLYASGDEIIAQSEFNDLLLSRNGGFDFNKFGTAGGEVLAAYESAIDDGFYWIYENGQIHRSLNGTSSSLYTTVPFHSGFDKIIDAKFVTYFDWQSGEDSSAMIIVMGKDGVPARDILISVDDGLNWKSLNYGNHFVSVPNLQSISVEENETLSIIAATESSVWSLETKGGVAWQPVFSAPGSHTILRMASRYSNALIESDSGLFAGFFEFFSGQWQFYDVSHTLEALPTGSIEKLFAGTDGYYMLRRETNNRIGLYKGGYGVDRWVEITESPLDVLNLTSVVDDFDFEDQEAILYAGANNGIWRLNQRAILTNDTVATSQLAPLNRGVSAQLEVKYKNDGTLFVLIDSLRITGSGSSSFVFQDTIWNNINIYAPMGIDIKSTTSVMIEYTATGLQSPTATLTAYYNGRSSRGQDSVLSMSTRLAGSAKAARISTGLKGDTLDFRGALLETTDETSFQLGNSGTDTLYVTGFGLGDGTYFKVKALDAVGTELTSFEVTPGSSQTFQLSFTPDANGVFRDSLVIYSTAHNYLTDQPDDAHVVRIQGMGSGVALENEGSIRPQLNQDLRLTISVAQLTTQEISGTLYYRETGDFTFTEKTLTPDATSGASGSARYTVTIPAEDVTSKGLEMYVEIRSTAGYTAYYPQDYLASGPYGLGVTIRSPGLSSTGALSLTGGTSAKAYQMISFPIRLDTRTASGAFAASSLGQIGDKGDWQLYRYDGTTGDFVSATDNSISFGEISHGKSYLLITRKPKTLNTGDGRTVTQAEATTTIEPGWNMLANPFTFNIPWSFVNYFNPKLNFANIVVLNNGRFRWVEDFEVQSLNLEPWKGYMYYSDPDSGTFAITYPAISTTATGSGTSKRRMLRSENLQSGEFLLDMVVRDDEGEMLHRAGQLRDALDEQDFYDRRPLPVLDERQIQLTFSNDRGKWHSDLRAVSEEGHTWEVTLATRSSRNRATLALGTTGLPEGWIVQFLHRGTGRVYGVDQAVDWSVGKDAPQEFRLIAGTQAYVEKVLAETIPTQFHLEQNYPNPFNPTTSIRYALPQTSRVRLSIYNTLGQLVATVFEGVQTAAVYTAAWNGRNQLGRIVSSGVYIYRLEAESIDGGQRFSQTRKMTFLK